MRKGEKMSDDMKEKLRLINKGKKLSPEHIEKLKKNHKGMSGRKHSNESKDKIGKANSIALLGKKLTEEHKKNISLGQPKGEAHHFFGTSNSGKDNPMWKGGMEFWKKQDTRNDGAYQFWRLEVFKRDNFKCRMLNEDCSGRIEGHHILSWTNYPDLRYQLNNGITLCHAHHPRKRAEEKRLEPLFRKLVSVSKE